MGSFGEFDGLLVTEQAVDEAFQFVDTDLTQTPQVLWLRLGGYSRQPKRRAFRLMGCQRVPEAHERIEQFVGRRSRVERRQLTSPQAGDRLDGRCVKPGRRDVAEEARAYDGECRGTGSVV